MSEDAQNRRADTAAAVAKLQTIADSLFDDANVTGDEFDNVVAVHVHWRDDSGAPRRHSLAMEAAAVLTQQASETAAQLRISSEHAEAKGARLLKHVG